MIRCAFNVASGRAQAGVPELTGYIGAGLCVSGSFAIPVFHLEGPLLWRSHPEVVALAACLYGRPGGLGTGRNRGARCSSLPCRSKASRESGAGVLPRAVNRISVYRPGRVSFLRVAAQE